MGSPEISMAESKEPNTSFQDLREDTPGPLEKQDTRPNFPEAMRMESQGGQFGMNSGSRIAEDRLTPRQLLALANKPDSLAANPIRAEKWLRALNESEGKSKTAFLNSFEKQVLPALRKQVERLLIGPQSDSDRDKISEYISIFSRFKLENPQLTKRILSNEDFLGLITVQNTYRNPVHIRNWTKDLEKDGELDQTINWLKSKLGANADENSRFNKILESIPHIRARESLLDHSLTLEEKLDPYALSLSLENLDSPSVEKLLEKYLGKTSDPIKALASCLTVLPNSVLNKYLDKLLEQGSAHYISALKFILERPKNDSNFEILDRKKVELVFDSLLKKSLTESEQTIAAGTQLDDPSLQALLLSNKLDHRLSYLEYKGKWASVDGYYFEKVVEKLSQADQIILLRRTLELLPTTNSKEQLKQIRESQTVRNSPELRDILKKFEKSSVVEENRKLYETLKLNEPKLGYSSAWKAEPNVLSHPQSDVDFIYRLKDGVKVPIGGFKYDLSNYAAVKEQYLEQVPINVNVYRFMHGSQEVQIRIEKSFDQKLNQLRELKDRFNKDSNQAFKLVPTGHLLPEEVASLVRQTIPATGHLRIIELREKVDPLHFLHPENPSPGHNPSTGAAADATAESGTVRIYSDTAYSAISNLKHEYLHLLERDAPFKVYQQAVRLEKKHWQGRDYGSTNDSEDWAVNTGELGLGSDPDKFIQFTREAPARAIAAGLFYKQILEHPGSLTDAQLKTITARLDYIEKNAIGAFRKSLEKALIDNNEVKVGEQFAFLTSLIQDGKSPEWALALLNGSSAKEFLENRFNHIAKGSNLQLATILLAAALEKAGQGHYKEILSEPLKELRQQFLKSADSTDPANSAKRDKLINFAVQLKAISAARASEVLSTAELLSDVSKTFAQIHNLTKWAETAVLDGTESEILNWINSSSKDSGRWQADQILAFLPGLKYQQLFLEMKTPPPEESLRSALSKLDKESAKLLLQSQLNRFQNQNKALLLALPFLPVEEQKAQIRRLSAKPDLASLQPLKELIEQRAKNDPEVLSLAKTTYLKIRPQVVEMLIQKATKEDLPEAEKNGLLHSKSLEARLQHVFQSSAHPYDLQLAMLGIERTDALAVLAVGLSLHDKSYRGMATKEFKSLPQYKVDADFRAIIDSVSETSGPSVAERSFDLSKLIREKGLIAKLIDAPDRLQSHHQRISTLLQLSQKLNPGSADTRALMEEAEAFYKSQLVKIRESAENSESSELNNIFPILNSILYLEKSLPDQAKAVSSARELADTFNHPKIKEKGPYLLKDLMHSVTAPERRQELREWLTNEYKNPNNSSDDLYHLADLFLAFNDLEARKNFIKYHMRDGVASAYTLSRAFTKLPEAETRTLLDLLTSGKSQEFRSELLANILPELSGNVLKESLEELTQRGTKEALPNLRTLQQYKLSKEIETTALLEKCFQSILDRALTDLNAKSEPLTSAELETFLFSQDLNHRLRFIQEYRNGPGIGLERALEGLSQEKELELFEKTLNGLNHGQRRQFLTVIAERNQIKNPSIMKRIRELRG